MTCYLRVLLVAVFLFSMSGGAIASECRSLIDRKCGSCHFSSKICPMLNKGKGSWAWKRNVRSMKDLGAVYTDQEEKRLVKCLSDPDEQVREICAGLKE